MKKSKTISMAAFLITGMMSAHADNGWGYACVAVDGADNVNATCSMGEHGCQGGGTEEVWTGVTSCRPAWIWNYCSDGEHTSGYATGTTYNDICVFDENSQGCLLQRGDATGYETVQNTC